MKMLKQARKRVSATSCLEKVTGEHGFIKYIEKRKAIMIFFFKSGMTWSALQLDKNHSNDEAENELSESKELRQGSLLGNYCSNPGKRIGVVQEVERSQK